jgi:phage terminase large subunit-like protein
VAILRAPWTPGYVAQLHAFPDTPRDDRVDASSDAFSELASHSDATSARPASRRSVPSWGF